MKIDGLTQRQFVVLMTVAKNEGLSQSAIGKRIGVDRSTLADIVHRLTKRGLRQLHRSPSDQRAYMIKLTGEGRQTLRTAEPLAKKIDERVLGALPTKHRERVIGALQTIVTILQSTSPQDGSPIMK